MTPHSRAMLGAALTPVLALAIASPAALAAPTAATATPGPAQDASTAAAAAPQLGPWTKPTRLNQSIGSMMTLKDGSVVALSGDRVLRRPAGATGWITMGFNQSAEYSLGPLTPLPDGSVQVFATAKDRTTWTAMLAPGATEFSAVQRLERYYSTRVEGSASGHVVAAWFMEGEVYASERTAQGIWSVPVVLNAPEVSAGGDVSLAVANDGTALVSWFIEDEGEDGGPTVRRYQTAEKAAGAAKWSTPRDLALTGDEPQAVQLFPRAKGGFHMVWKGTGGRELSYARRSAGTMSWSPAELIGTGGGNFIARVEAPIDLPNGDVFLVGVASMSPWYGVRSEAKGAWATGQRFPASEAGTYSMSSVRAADGTVVVAWNRDGRSWVSTFAGGTWATPTLLSASSGPYFDLSLDHEGRPLVVFSQDEPDAEGIDRSIRYLTATTPRKPPVRRDLTGDGKADVLGLSTAGNLKLLSGAGLTKAPFTVPGWDPAAEVLPFADLNGDRCNDVFVRLPGGEARMYTPVCGGLPSPGSAYRKIASDWKAYDSFSAPGDLTGDGRTDLLAREAATGTLYLYADNGAGGFAARVKVGPGWNTYKKIIGAGDLTGDGKADLLALDASGELWRYNGTGNGNGTGTFKSRALVFKDWGGSYKDVVGAGDLNGDGKADLLSRDTAGRPWLNAGNGTGGFGNRTAIGTEPVWNHTKIS
ncbi:FG-GAP repeat domain-containing protein [Streptomyces sp. NPDC002104]